MIISIAEGFCEDEIIIGSDDKRFYDAWGGCIRTCAANLFNVMKDLDNWAYTIEECISFELR